MTLFYSVKMLHPVCSVSKLVKLPPIKVSASSSTVKDGALRLGLFIIRLELKPKSKYKKEDKIKT